MASQFVRVNTLELAPTQPCIGRFEVLLKQDRFKLMSHRDIDGYLREKSEKGKAVQIVKRLPRYYIVDGHHTLTAILEANEPRDLELEQVADYTDCEDDATFWKKMQKKGWALTRNCGDEVEPSSFPETLEGLCNDPFRSLAWLIRKMNAFNDLKKPYVEFEVADYLREQMQFQPEHFYEYETAALRAFELMQQDAAAEFFADKGLKTLIRREKVKDLLARYYEVLETARAPRYYRNL